MAGRPPLTLDEAIADWNACGSLDGFLAAIRKAIVMRATIIADELQTNRETSEMTAAVEVICVAGDKLREFRID